MTSVMAVQGVAVILITLVAWEIWRTALLAAFRHLVLGVRDDVWMAELREGRPLDAADHASFRESVNDVARFAHMSSNLSLILNAMVCPLPLGGRAQPSKDRFSVQRETIANLLGVYVMLAAPIPVVVLLMRALAAALLRPNAATHVASAPQVPVRALNAMRDEWARTHREAMAA